MESDRTFYDRDYKRTCSYIGWTLLIFVGIFYVLSYSVEYFLPLLSDKMDYKWYYTLDSVVDMAVYLSSFLLPSLFLRQMLKRKDIFQETFYSFKFKAMDLLLIPVTIAIALVASYFNSYIMSFFAPYEVYSELVGMNGANYEMYQILLMYLSSALVPAFCEEFLFRGTILANLMPYGKSGAVVITSLLFGLMHRNPYQLIYTTVTAAVLAMAYLITRSIWLPFLMHLVNNVYFVTNQVIYGNVRPNLANSIILVSQVLIVVLGIIAMVFYIKLFKKEAAHKFDDGFFGKEISQDFRCAQKPLSRGYAVKGFFRPSIIIFGIIVVFLMISLMLTLFMMMYYGVETIL